jgi:hypothetical protein
VEIRAHYGYQDFSAWPTLLRLNRWPSANRCVGINIQSRASWKFAFTSSTALWKTLFAIGIEAFALLPRSPLPHKRPTTLHALYHHGMIERIPPLPLDRLRSAYRVVLHTHLRSHPPARTRKNTSRTISLHRPTPPLLRSTRSSSQILD